MCKVLDENVHEAVKTSITSQPASVQLRANLNLETISEDINRILSQQQNPPLEQPVPSADKQSQPENQNTIAEPSSPQTEQDTHVPDAVVETETKNTTESEATKDSNEKAELDADPTAEKSKASNNNPAVADVDSSPKEPTSSPGITGTDVDMEEAKNDADTKTDDEPTQKGDAGVIVLDD